MEYFRGTKTQISPCIAAKAKFALHLTKIKPSNSQTCSQAYWLKVIDTLSFKHNVSTHIRKEAIKKYKLLIK